MSESVATSRLNAGENAPYYRDTGTIQYSLEKPELQNIPFWFAILCSKLTLVAKSFLSLSILSFINRKQFFLQHERNRDQNKFSNVLRAAPENHL